MSKNLNGFNISNNYNYISRKHEEAVLNQNDTVAKDLDQFY